MKKFGIMLVVAVIFTGCMKEKKEEKIKPKGPKVVKVLKLEQNNLATSYEYPAEIYPARQTSMAFEVSGRIVKFNYKEGQYIPKGAVIAILDDTILKANFSSARANFNQAKMDYKRYEALYNSQSIAKAELERVKQALDVTKAAYEVASKNLGETKLVAEFGGLMAKKLVNDFARITAKQPIVLLQDNSYYKVKFYAPEHDVIRLKGGLSVENISTLLDIYVTLGNGEKKIYPAKFTDIATTAELVTRTFETTLRMEQQKDMNILPGMTAKVEVVPKKVAKELYYVPTQAIFSDKNAQAMVWSVDKNMRVHKVSVVLGQMEGKRVQILKGLDGVENIVLSGVRFLKENDEVKVYKKMGE